MIIVILSVAVTLGVIQAAAGKGNKFSLGLLGFNTALLIVNILKL